MFYLSINKSIMNEAGSKEYLFIYFLQQTIFRIIPKNAGNIGLINKMKLCICKFVN